MAQYQLNVSFAQETYCNSSEKYLSIKLLYKVIQLKPNQGDKYEKY